MKKREQLFQHGAASHATLDHEDCSHKLMIVMIRFSRDLPHLVMCAVGFGGYAALTAREKRKVFLMSKMLC